MLINKRCTVCHRDIEASEADICGSCGRRIHEECATFERAFECRECADEPEIGIQEF